MSKYLLFLFFAILSVGANAQTTPKNDVLIDGDKLSKLELYGLHSDGWIQMKYRGKTYLLNLSNKDYILHFSVNCKDNSKKPSYLIEFSNSYGDGNYGGIDFISSEVNASRKVVFFIDEHEFHDPFENFDKETFKNFKDALKDGKILNIKYFDSKFNTETKKDQFELNRELKFTLKNPQLLDATVDCMK